MKTAAAAAKAVQSPLPLRLRRFRVGQVIPTDVAEEVAGAEGREDIVPAHGISAITEKMKNEK